MAGLTAAGYNKSGDFPFAGCDIFDAWESMRLALNRQSAR
jgi:hypothetical protein